MFTLMRSGKSVRNFTCDKVFATYFGWIRANKLASERDKNFHSRNYARRLEGQLKLSWKNLDPKLKGEIEIYMIKRDAMLLNLRRTKQHKIVWRYPLKP